MSESIPFVKHRFRSLPLLVALLGLAVLCGCGGGGGLSDDMPGMTETTASSEDTTAPSAAAALSVTNDNGEIIITWTNPSDADFSGVLLRRGDTDFPGAPTSGDLDTDTTLLNTAATAYVDTGMPHGVTRYYSLFTYDTSGNYSAAATATVTVSYEPFTFIALPDTQYMSLDYPALYNTMTQWVADNAVEQNIEFVLHEGDMTHNNTDAEWANAHTAMHIMDNKAPWVPCAGNHDMKSGEAAKLDEYFPVSDFENLPYYGGVYEAGEIHNSYFLFSAGGTDWLVINIEYNPDDDILEWAGQVAAAYPDRRAILLTHAYLWHTNERTSIGNNIWNKLVKKYANFIFVFNGHYTTGEGGRLVSEGDNGNKVYQMFANYQDLAFGGLGLLRIVTLDPDAKTVDVKTYSPWMKTYRDDDANQFTFEDVDFGPVE